MRTYKIVVNTAVIILAAAALLPSCKDGELPFVKRDLFEASENRNRELSSTLENVQENYARQNRELNSILSELSSISYRTTQLQIDAENGEVEQTQTELIYNNIDALKARIDKLEREAARARQVDKKLALAASTIKQLRNTLECQEREINLLKDKIAEHEATIKGQQDTIADRDTVISNQSSTITSQKKELERIVGQQTEMLYQAGIDLEAIADEGDFAVSGHRNRRNVREYRISIYRKAITFFEMASSQGLVQANEKITEIEEKIEGLK